MAKPTKKAKQVMPPGFSMPNLPVAPVAPTAGVPPMAPGKAKKKHVPLRKQKSSSGMPRMQS